MKLITILSQILLLTSSFTCADADKKINHNSSANNAGGFAVVELFTSEGCSSCPPADNAVARLLKQHNSNVYVLAYHVDYWDNLGWKDMFSSATYTQMQRDYARTFKLSSVYTPQVVVNGSEQFVGSDENKLNAAINKDLQQTSANTLNITAKAMDDKEVVVNYTTNASASKLKIALVQLSAENKIKRGENSGATLHHVNIVRDIKVIAAAEKGIAVLKIPDNVNTADCKVIAVAQNVNDAKITAADETNIQ